LGASMLLIARPCLEPLQPDQPESKHHGP